MRWRGEEVKMIEWQPGVIAPRDVIKSLHPGKPDDGTPIHSGRQIRVRLCPEALIPPLVHTLFKQLGCTGRKLLIHPDDCMRLYGKNMIVTCECCVLVD